MSTSAQYSAFSIKVLVIDDDEDDAVLVEKMLQSDSVSHYEVVWARSETEGLVQCGDHYFDVCFLDYNLGKENGLDVLKELREIVPDMPVIFLTGFGSPGLDRQASDAGAADFLNKDEITPSLLERAIRYVMTWQRALNEVSEAHATMEQRVRDRTAELYEAKRMAELATRTRTDFLATMSHEFRTPLNAIIGFSDLLKLQFQHDMDKDKIDQYVDFIRDSGEHLHTLITEILEVSRLDEDQFALKRTYTDLRELVISCLRNVSARASDQRIRVENFVPKTLPKIYVDEHALKTVLLNILTNALKFTQEEGLVRIEAEINKDGACVVSVRDTGIGMDEAGIAVAMSNFGRVRSERNNAEEGLGLGLPLAKGLVDAHGGSPEIASEKDKGTVVSVIIPNSARELEKLVS